MRRKGGGSREQLQRSKGQRSKRQRSKRQSSKRQRSELILQNETRQGKLWRQSEPRQSRRGLRQRP
jgi:hypothetical protein